MAFRHIYEGIVQALASFLYDVLNEININSGIIAFHIKAGIDFVLRCHMSNTFKKVEEFIESDRIDEIVRLKVNTTEKVCKRE